MEELRHEAWAQAVVWVPAIAVALGLLLLFFVLARVAHFGVLRIVGRTRAHGPLGVNITGIVAGLGLTGFALGFALKDSIANLLAGVLILLYRPFDIGDRADVGGLSGHVVKIDLRYTELDTLPSASSCRIRSS